MAAEKDAWGETDVLTYDLATKPIINAPSTAPTLDFHFQPAYKLNRLAALPPVPSLQSLCLGVLALHLGELVECGEEVLPYLPADAKASLLAAARYRQELTDTSLRLLADQEHTTLDVHTDSTPLQITPAGVLGAARIMSPNLRFVELRGCANCCRPKFLKSLAAACPLIEVLRLGGAVVGVDVEALGEAILSILPRLEQSNADAIAESWEEAVIEDQSSLSVGRLLHLRCLLWPEIPHETKLLCENLAPAVVVNPSLAKLKSRRLPPQCDISYDLDDTWLKQVAGYEVWEVGNKAKLEKNENSPVVIHIAERFRLAFESQEKRLKKRDDRLWRKQTREILASGGERAIREWEYGF